ncbi:hypothetical protein [Comamonas odontotermitis]|uniref:hypothetical protein n=1 Tax=Comamonas odontotermitis TaxID=379895 RepID=UPI001CC33781|nr:hypothetical protein [Comamonas odontotermitis]UBB17785.1 hypothetical protein LAD35_03825 [Comamonas odontotermitis]
MNSTEARDILMGLAGQVPGQAVFMLTGQWIIMALTIVLLLVQIGYYARKWMREETELGRKLCRMLCRWRWGKWFCQFGGCDEQNS